MMLESRNKFDIKSPNRERAFTPEQFFNWSNQHHYRTSYNDMKSPVAAEKKNHAIPKYQGYVPGMTANNELGARYTQVTRKCFDKKKLDDAPNFFSSTGFNWTKIPKQDETLQAWTHKYGAQTMAKPHPSIKNDKATTIFRQSYSKPQSLVAPTMRHSSSCQALPFDNQLKDSWKTSTFASGFQHNAQTGDNKGWVPEKMLHSDMVRTEYRNRYNGPKPFQQMTLRMSTGKLTKRALFFLSEYKINMENYLNFQPLKPLIDVQFWLHFTNLKLDDWKLSNPKIELQGNVSLPMNQQYPSNLLIDDYSLKNKKKKTIGGLLQSKVDGVFIHVNTIEEYKALDLQLIAEEESKHILDSHKDFQHVNKFVVASFGDLKNYNYHYKYLNIELEGQLEVAKSNKLEKFISKLEIEKIGIHLLKFITEEEEFFCFTLLHDPETKQYTISKEINEQLFSENAYFCYFDPSPLLPSSLLKNYLVKINRLFQEHSKLQVGECSKLQIISIRDKISKLNDQIILNDTFYIEVKFKKEEDNPDKQHHQLKIKQIDQNIIKDTVISLKEQLDPKVVAENAVDLNLKLMKWRMLPDIDLDIIKNTSCLLMGSGSLGCQVARNLLAWGFRKITFVDYGKVSYSNPVRQCLFTFADSQRPDNNKCEVAAERLLEVFPSAVTRGEKLRIPMPGHAVGKSEEAVKEMVGDLNRLDELVKEHDVVFLLTDSRESRWLPAVQAAVYQKICLTIALGFESFLVMRHGLNSFVHNNDINGERLGCYFCNDVVAPRDSLSDRTLDQQCTVSRPALCCIASSIGVELLVSMLNHPLKNGAKANENPSECDKSQLGIIPQQIRGDLYQFGINVMYGEAFDKCTGCSKDIIQAYIDNKEEFLLRVCNQPDYLEEITGITAMLEKVKMDDIECFDFDEEMI